MRSVNTMTMASLTSHISLTFPYLKGLYSVIEKHSFFAGKRLSPPKFRTALLYHIRAAFPTARTGELPPGREGILVKTAKKPPFPAALLQDKYDYSGAFAAGAGFYAARNPLPMISLELTMVIKAWLSFSRKKLRSWVASRRVSTVMTTVSSLPV